MAPWLALHPPSRPPAARLRRYVFLVVWLGVVAMVIWPIYPRFAGLTPRFLGLPLSFAWAILAILVTFVALVWLYLSEPDDASTSLEGR